MSEAPSIFFAHVIVRSFIFGLLLAGFVYVSGASYGLWTMSSVWKIFLIVIIGSMLLLPFYERLSGFTK